MYAGEVAEGIRIDLHPESPNGVDIVYDHPYTTIWENRGQTHAYEYSGNSPVKYTDPSGLLIGWAYGNYCGWSRRGPGAPIDATDAACQRHDQCQATWWTCNPWHIFYCSYVFCTELLDVLKRRRCDQSYPIPDPLGKYSNAAQDKRRQACKDAARKVAALFCTISGGTIGPGPLLPPGE